MTRLVAYCLEWHITKSHAFSDVLVEPLKPYADIQLMPWEPTGVSAQPFERGAVLIFCEVQPPDELLADPRARIVWLPMLDNVVGYPQEWWNRFPKSLRVVAFSEHVAQRARTAGLCVLRLKYFPDPKKFAPADWSRGRILFYWNRVGLASPALLRRICQAAQVQKLILRDQPDPGIASVSPLAIQSRLGRTAVEHLPAFLPREEYLRAVGEANIHIAPRVFEGAGMAFLEAMARGCAVFATDTPTMNEYIVHKENGYLFSPRGAGLKWYRLWQRWVGRIMGSRDSKDSLYVYTVPPRLQNWNEIARMDIESLGMTALKRHQAGYTEWQKQIECYARFILDW